MFIFDKFLDLSIPATFLNISKNISIYRLLWENSIRIHYRAPRFYPVSMGPRFYPVYRGSKIYPLRVHFWKKLEIFRYIHFYGRTKYF